MLKFRRVQMAALENDRRNRFIVEMSDHLRTYFPDAMQPYTDTQLHEHVDRAITDAGDFGIENRRYVCKFLNLCGSYGWKFWAQPQNQWMLRKYLKNPAIPSPDRRLDLLINQCLWRMETEEHNRALQKKYQGGESPRPEGAHGDDSGRDTSVPLLEKDDT